MPLTARRWTGRSRPRSKTVNRGSLNIGIRLADGRRRVIQQRIEVTDGVLQGTAQDITDLRHAQEALIDSEDRFRRLAENMPGAVYEYRVSPDGSQRFDYISGQVEELSGISAEDLADDPSPWIDMIHPDDKPSFFENFERSRANLSLWTWEGRNVFDDGQIKWVRGIAVPRRLEDGSTVWSGITFDVTEARLLQEQLRQSQKMEAVGQLTGGVAHDYNNLMAVMLGNAERLLDEIEKPDQREMVEAIIEAVRRGGDLTTSLLAFSRNQTVSPRQVNVSDLCRNLWEMLNRSLGENVRLEIEVEEDLFADIDPTHLETSILNLALNARDAMDQSGVLRIRVSEAKLTESDLKRVSKTWGVGIGSYVIIEVSDNGAGIPSEMQDRVFEPFFTTKDGSRGSGLGLSMVHGFVAQSRGFIQLESEPGTGTTFTLAVPSVAAAVIPEADRPAVAPVNPSRGRSLERF